MAEYSAICLEQKKEGLNFTDSVVDDTRAEGEAQTVVKEKTLDKIAINALVELLVAIMENKRK